MSTEPEEFDITVRSFVLGWIPEQAIEMPAGARILSADNDGEEIVVWAIVDTKAKVERRTFLCVSTEGDAKVAALKTSRHIGSPQFNDGKYAIHVFVKREGP